MKLSLVFEYIDKATSPIKHAEVKLNGFSKTLDKARLANSKYNEAVKWLGNVKEVVSKIARPEVELNQAMTDLSAVTGIVGKDLDYLEKVARRTGIASGLGAAGAADAFTLLASQIDVGKTGLSGLVELQGTAITLAQASGMNMEEAAQAMAGTINLFKLQASDANRVMNVLVAGSKYGAAEIPQLAASFQAVGDAANTAGLSVEQTTGVVEMLSKNNLKGAKAGMALRNIIQSMQMAMGVDFSKTSFQEALEQLKPHLKDVVYMSKLFGAENMVAARFLVAHSDKVQEMTDQVTDTNVAMEQAAIRMDTWSEKLKRGVAWIDDIGISLIQMAPGILKVIEVANQAQPMISALTSLSKLVGKLGKGVWTAGLGVVKFGRVLRLLSVAKATGSAELFARMVSRSGRMGKVAAGMLGGYQKAVSFCSLALKGATWRQLGHSVAVKAAAFWTGVCTRANQVAAGVMAAWNAITTAATWTELRKTATTKLHTMWTLLSGKAMWVAGVATAGWTKVVKIATFIQGGFMKVLRAGRTLMITGLIPALSGAIASTWAWTTALLSNPITWIVLAIGALIATIIICWQKFAGFRAVIYTIWDAIKGLGLALYYWLVTPLKAIAKIFSGLGKAIFKLFTGDFKGAAEEFTGAFKAGFQEGVEGFEKCIDNVKSGVGDISGNYEMHLAEEQAEQAEKENAKQKKTVEKEGVHEAAALKTREVVNVMASEKQNAKNSLAAEVVPQGEGMGVRAEGENPLVHEDGGAAVMISAPVTQSVENALKSSEVETSLIHHDNNFSVPGISLDILQHSENDGVEIADIKAPLISGDAGYSHMGDAGLLQTNLFDPGLMKGEMSDTDGMPGGAKIDIHFQPVVHVSADMTEKGKNDFITMLKGFAEEIARMVEEVQRKDGRGAYAIS